MSGKTPEDGVSKMTLPDGKKVTISKAKAGSRGAEIGSLVSNLANMQESVERNFGATRAAAAAVGRATGVEKMMPPTKEGGIGKDRSNMIGG